MKITWNDVDKFVSEVANIIENEWQTEYVGVYGPPRGGLPLAVMFSHRLNIPLLQAPAIGCLIVDDIADSGITLNKYADDFDIVTLAYYDKCLYTPKFYCWTKEDEDDWVVFPWEESGLVV